VGGHRRRGAERDAARGVVLARPGGVQEARGFRECGGQVDGLG
jgi:hypothetical protein